jgi:tRNA A-37 threonylcarbamoyl transferase component Bud32
VTAVYVDGARFTLSPQALLGQGGEAEVYDLGDGRVVKWWKRPEHADFEGLPDAQAAARRRIAEAPAKLRALPGNLARAVVAPCGFALAAKRSQEVVGYVMPKVSGTALHAFGEPKWRRDHPVAGADVVAALVALHDAIAGLHRAGIVIGDCNDLNVLVDGRAVHLIDVDSYQFAGYACSMFSERFVDPRLCDAQLQPLKPHDRDSDWFAFAAMAMRSLLGVGPWGGVHQPAVASQRCAAPARPARRLSVLGADIVYPRAARPLEILPDDLLAVFRGIFERDVRGVFPRVELERLQLRPCATCGDEHARLRCPSFQTRTHVPPAFVHGRLKWTALAQRPEPTTLEVGTTATQAVWLAGDALIRATRLGPERIGSVLAGQTRAWIGAKLGAGFYRAGGYAVGFVFRPDRGTLDDRVKLPKLRGQLASAHAVIGDDRAWLFLTLADAGKLVTTCIVIGADARVLAGEVLADHTWLAGSGGACAAGPHLFVPTDDGIARIEVVQGAIAHTRTFPETAALVSAADHLSLATGGIAVARRRDAVLLQLT